MSDKLDKVFEGLVRPPKGSGVNCRRCGQELKDPESIKMGIGPVCANKEREEADEAHDPLQENEDANDE